MTGRFFSLRSVIAASSLCRFAGKAVCIALGTWMPAAAADVYKCADKDDRITYQDQPCAAGQGGIMRGENDRIDPRRAAATAEALRRLRRNVADLEQARRSGENAAEVASLQREIESYDRLERDEIAVLQQEQRYADNNAVAAVWDRAAFKQGIAKEMQAITDKYAAKRQAARDRIAQLQRAPANAAPPR